VQCHPGCCTTETTQVYRNFGNFLSWRLRQQVPPIPCNFLHNSWSHNPEDNNRNPHPANFTLGCVTCATLRYETERVDPSAYVMQLSLWALLCFWKCSSVTATWLALLLRGLNYQVSRHFPTTCKQMPGYCLKWATTSCCHSFRVIARHYGMYRHLSMAGCCMREPFGGHSCKEASVAVLKRKVKWANCLNYAMYRKTQVALQVLTSTFC